MNDFLVGLVPWFDAIGRSLLHFVWQGALIGLAYVSLRPFCSSIASRYRLGMATLMLMLLTPIITLAWLRPIAGKLDDRIVSAVSGAVPAIGDAVGAAASSWVSDWRWEQALPWLVVAWLIGVCAIATRSFLHWHRLARVVRTALPLPRDWQLRLIQLRQQFGVLRNVRLLSSVHVATPTLIGWLKPAILLPASLLSGFTPSQIELIIAHELSHVRRFDYIANLVQVMIETLLFYHPAVLLISRDVRQARESCCDDLVLTLGGGDAVAYARTLADLEELHNDFGPAVPVLGVGGGLLLARIRRLVDPTYASALDPLPRSNGITLPVIVACAGLALALLRMHLIPATIVNAFVPSLSVEWTKESAVLQLPPVTAVTSAPMIPVLARVIATSVPAAAVASTAKTIPSEVEQPAPIHPVVAAPAPQIVAPHAESTNADLLASSIRAPAPVAEAPARAAPSSPATHATSGPEPTQVVQARYPLDALRSGVTGKVDVDFRIAADGSVRDIRVMHAQPAGVFDQAATAAIRQWRFNVPAGSDPSRRYARSFAFTRADSAPESCREVTGSHICRRQSQEMPEN